MQIWHKFCKNSIFSVNMQLFKLFYVRGIVGGQSG
nr:MAG TPA: hypothetical protein [Crassvirales sp.]